MKEKNGEKTTGNNKNFIEITVKTVQRKQSCLKHFSIQDLIEQTQIYLKTWVLEGFTTLLKKKRNFPQEIQKGSGAKSYMTITNGPLIYD